MNISIVKSVNIITELQKAYANGQLDNSCVLLHKPTVAANLYSGYMDFRENLNGNTEMSVFGFEDISKDIFKEVIKNDPSMLIECYPIDFQLLASLKLGDTVSYKHSRIPTNVIVYI